MPEALSALMPQVPLAVWWLLASGLVAVGIVGIVMPVLPGAALVLAGLALAAWIDGFVRVTPIALAVIAALAVLAWLTDYVAALLGAKTVGASRWALVGAALGTVLGVFAGFIGLLFLPFVGAVLGELWAQRERSAAGGANQALKVGLGTWIGLLVGTAVKLALVFAMVGTFVLAWLI